MPSPIKTLKRARTLRREMSHPEVILWMRLRLKNEDGVRFRRQHPVGPYVLDFFCAKAQLAVEIDGQVHSHADVPAHDGRRDARLAAQGLQVLRLEAKAVLDDPDGVADSLHIAAVDRLGARR